MTLNEAKKKLNEACNLIFEVESEFKDGDWTRTQGYRARIVVQIFENHVRATTPNGLNAVIGNK